VLKQWLNRDRSGWRGTPAIYSDLAIETMATLQALFRLPGQRNGRRQKSAATALSGLREY
jgi:hypothetical protein